MQSRPKILTILRLGASSTLLALLGSELRAPVDSLNHPDHSLEFCLESSQIKGIRQHIRHLTTGTSLESHTQEADEEILLVDEVDVFFGEDCCHSLLHVVLVCKAVLLSIQWHRSDLDMSLLLCVFPHVRVRFEFRQGARCDVGSRSLTCLTPTCTTSRERSQNQERAPSLCTRRDRARCDSQTALCGTSSFLGLAPIHLMLLPQ